MVLSLANTFCGNNMGSFNMTCCLSGLPISAGDEIKYFLLTENPYEDNIVCYIHDMWFPRTWPLRSKYNDYGSIEDYDEKSPAAYILIEGLKTDLVEVGVGNNSVHDVSTKKGMPFKDTLDAIWEGRLLVERETNDSQAWKEKHAEQFEEPEGLPTLQNVERVLRDAGHLVENTDKGYLVDEREYGWVRVRCGGFGSRLDLGSILPLLQEKYAAMLTVGTGNYAHGSEIQLMPKPMGRKNPHLSIHRNESEKPLKVFQGMILTEVWDALLEITDYQQVRKEVQKIWDSYATLQPRFKEILGEGPIYDELREMQEEAKNFTKLCRTWGIRGRGLADSGIPFTMGLAEHLQIAVEQHQKFTSKQIEEFLDDVAGFSCLQRLLYPVRHWWRPSFSCGPQDGFYTEHKKWHEILFKVSAKLAKAYENNED